MKLSLPLKLIVSHVFGKSLHELEQTKDTVLPGQRSSYRDAQIHTYLQLEKVFGSDWLGKWLVNDIENAEQEYFVLSDGGRDDDLVPLIRRYQPHNIQIIQIMREGCSFSNDIRSYISATNIKIRPCINKDLSAFKAEMVDFAAEFFAN
jgi:hypothetical protein